MLRRNFLPLFLLITIFSLATQSYALKGKLIIRKAKTTTASSSITTVQPALTPISGSHIYLFQVGTNGPGGKPYSLITCGDTGVSSDGVNCYVTTDSNGDFDIPEDWYYNCEDNSSDVYLLGLGGNAGDGSNSQIVQMAVIPENCGDMQSYTGSVYISDETTVAAAFAVAPVANNPGAQSGSYNDGLSSRFASNAAVLVAFQAANNLVSTFTNELAISDTTVQDYINTIADVSDECIDSDGSTSSGSGCYNLYNDTVYYITPTDSYEAVLSMSQAPFNNVSTLYEAASTSSPWQPILSSAPESWTLPISGAPSISYITPATSNDYAAGSTQTITGTNLVDGSTTPIVICNGVQATISGTPTSTSITFVVPHGAATDGFVAVYTGTYASNASAFGPDYL